MSLSKNTPAAGRTGSETPPSVAKDSPHATNASVTSSSTSAAHHLKANINDSDHPPDRTLWLGDLEPWMDDHYMVQVCTLFGWETSAIHIPRPPAAPNATRHPNNAGYCLLVFASQDKAKQVVEQYGPEAPINPQPVLLPNSNRPIKVDWLSSSTARSAIGKEPGPIDNAIEYSIFVGDIAADVTNADLMNVFRNPNLGLRGDFPPRLIAPFLSCCNAKVMVDSVTGISKGYGFVRFTSEEDQKRALVEMQGLYCKSRPMRLSTATAKNKNVTTDDENTETMPVVVRMTPSSGPVSPPADPSRIRSVTSVVAEGAASRNSQRGEYHPIMLAKIAQLSNTMGQYYPAYRAGANGATGGPVLPPPGLSTSQIQQWLHANPQARSQLETILGSGNDPIVPSDPLNTTVFVGGLSPLISEETLRTFFAPFGAIHYVKVPPGKSCGFVQFVRKSDAERAIEALSGFSIGGSKVRLSWGRIPAAQGAAQAAAAAAAANNTSSTPTGQHNRPTSTQSSNSDGPLSSEQALHIVEKLVPALMAAANNGNVSGQPHTLANAGVRHPHQHQMLPPRAPVPGYRDHYGYSNGPSQGSNYSNAAGAMVPPSPFMHPGSHMDYGRNDFFYDTPNGAVTGYGGPLAYGGMNMNSMGPISPAMGSMGMGGYGRGGGASNIDESILGNYSSGLHRGQNLPMRQNNMGGYGGSGYGLSAGNFVGGQYGADYEADLSGFRYQQGNSSRGYGAPSSNTYDNFDSNLYGNGSDMPDRFSGDRASHFNMGSGGTNGLSTTGMNGLNSPTGGGSGGGTSPYAYSSDNSPHFKATDILRHESSGISSYLSGNTSSNHKPLNSSMSSGTSGARSSGANKPNGHVHGAPGSRINTNMLPGDGMPELTGMFAGLGVSSQGSGNSGLSKSQISPVSAGGMGSGSFSTQQHFRGDSGRFN
ncbi:hypothetical protein CPB86DRAFT_703059 [Serendipita vermifera]|nr:hypothetical protein CPB86DRAFT_703059 [Serendipita vermifera]